MRTGSPSGRAAASARRANARSASTSSVKKATATSASRLVTASGDPGPRAIRTRWRGGVGLLVAAEEVLGGRAGGGERHPHAGLAGRDQVDRLEQRDDAAVEVAGRAKHLREAGERSQASAAVRLRHEPQGSAEPARGGSRCARRRRRARLQQQGDRRGVALRRRLLDVMGPGGGRPAASRQAARRAGVGDEPPSAAGGLVDRAAHERVAEREAPRHGRRVQQAHVEQLVERRHPLVRRQLPDLAGELGLERVTRDRARVQQHCARGSSARPAPPPGPPPRCAERRRRSRRGPRTGCAAAAVRRARAAARRTGCRRSR